MLAATGLIGALFEFLTRILVHFPVTAFTLHPPSASTQRYTVRAGSEIGPVYQGAVSLNVYAKP